MMELLLKSFPSEELEIGRTMGQFSYQHLGFERAISILLDFGIDVNSSFRGATMLATAAYHRWEDLVERLLDKGAKVNTKCENDSFSYALDAAMIEPMHESIARRLVANGARMSGRSVTHILRLVRSDKSWDNVLQLLQRNEVNNIWVKTSRQDFDDYYATSPLIEEVRAGNLDSVQDLIKFGADVNLRVDGYYGDALNTAFLSTLDRGFSLTQSCHRREYPTITGRYPTAQLVEALVKAGANLQSLKGERLDTALAAAALAGLEQMVDDFLGRDASPSAICAHKFTTALGAAAASTEPGAPDMVGKLVANRAVVNTYFPDQSAEYGEQCRYALDFPLQLMLEEDRPSKEPDHTEDAERNQRLNTWLKSASVLVSHGAIWDIDFSEWKKCLEKVDADFSQQEAERLDEIRQGLEENNLNRTNSLEPRQSTPDVGRRISFIMWLVCM